MTTKLALSQCMFCTRRAFPALGAVGQTCTAFPDGIPDPIWHNQVDHRRPYPGDRGQRFESALPDGQYPPEDVLVPIPDRR